MEEREPSYYEIALTHRQVFGVFVVLLLSVVVAFLAGLWLGRREGVVLPAASVAEQAPLVDEEGEELGELNFFSEAPTPPPATAPERSEPSPPAAAEPRESPAPPARAAERQPAPRSQEESTRASSSTTAPDPDALVVQVFSSADRPQAQSVVDRLREAGFAALLSPVEVDRRTMYRVRIGPFATREDAEQVAARVRRDFRLDTWITR